MKTKKHRRGAVFFAFAVILTLAFLLIPPHALSESDGQDADETARETRRAIEDEASRLSRETDLSAWQSYFDELRSLAPSLSSYSSVHGFVAALAGGEEEPGLGSIVRELFLPGLRSALRRMLGVVLIAMLGGAAGILLEDGPTKKTMMLALSSAAVLSCAALFSQLAGTAVSLTGDIARFSELSSPILGALLAVLGCTGSAAFLAPKLAFIAEGIALLINGVILPMLLASGVLTVMDALGGSLRFDRTVKLLHKTAKWLLSLAAAVYAAAAVTGGIKAGAADGVSLRAARFAIDRLIPSAGGMIGGAADAVRAGSLLVKNAAGTAAILMLAAAVIRPAVSIACGMLAFRIAAAAVEPFSDDRMPKLLDELADTVSLLLASAASAASMFVVTVVMILCCGSMLFG